MASEPLAATGSVAERLRDRSTRLATLGALEANAVPIPTDDALDAAPALFDCWRWTRPRCRTSCTNAPGCWWRDCAPRPYRAARRHRRRAVCTLRIPQRRGQRARGGAAQAGGGADAGGRPQPGVLADTVSPGLLARQHGTVEDGGLHGDGVPRPRESPCTARVSSLSSLRVLSPGRLADRAPHLIARAVNGRRANRIPDKDAE